MQVTKIIIGTIALLLAVILTSTVLYAQTPGERCDPDYDVGHTTRIVSITGNVNIYERDGSRITGAIGTITRPGSIIQTGDADNVELALEDGTKDRKSRIRVEAGSQVVLSGGLYCDDLRPKANEGRWTVREIIVDLRHGSLQIEIAPEVSHNLKLAMDTPNAKIQMERRTQESMIAKVKAGGLADRAMVSVIEHPRVLQNIRHMLMGRTIEDLDPRTKEAVMMQAIPIAMNMGLLDLDEDSLLEHPDIGPTVAAMTGGRSIDTLDEGMQQHVTQMIIALAMQHGLLDPDTLMVYEHPDKHTYVTVDAGTVNVYNTLRGYSRDEVVTIASGKFSEVYGYDPPTLP